jgi:hypothetical protein
MIINTWSDWIFCDFEGATRVGTACDGSTVLYASEPQTTDEFATWYVFASPGPGFCHHVTIICV